MRLSVILPAFNEQKLITGSVSAARHALRSAGLPAANVEIIVVDNASTDSTRRLAEAMGARVVREPIRQIARARNTGAASARGDWYLFLDADCWLSAGLAAGLLHATEDVRIAGGGATVRMHDIPLYMSAALWAWNRYSRWFKCGAGSFLFCRAKAFAAIGGFDCTYFVAEEIDFTRRLKRWGRAHGRRFVVLHANALLTSARKAELYGFFELMRLLLSMLHHPRRFFRDRALCYAWYDGRR